jgi:hypothetical protein
VIMATDPRYVIEDDHEDINVDGLARERSEQRWDDAPGRRRQRRQQCHFVVGAFWVWVMQDIV